MKPDIPVSPRHLGEAFTVPIPCSKATATQELVVSLGLPGFGACLVPGQCLWGCPSSGWHGHACRVLMGPCWLAVILLPGAWGGARVSAVEAGSLGGTPAFSGQQVPLWSQTLRNICGLHNTLSLFSELREAQLYSGR